MAPKTIFIFILLVFFLAGCSVSTQAAASGIIPSETPTLVFNSPTSIPTPASTLSQTQSILPAPVQLASKNQVIVDLAFTIIEALKDKNMSLVAQYVNPQQGLRFSPYSYVKESDQVFPAEKVAGLMDDSTVYLWGNYDGSGEPINLSFAEYYPKFVYPVDFVTAPQLSLNHRLSTGNSIDNSQEFYPGGMIVEFYFPGFEPQYAGMDWRSLRFVFMQSNNDWYLTGIIHDQWTT